MRLVEAYILAKKILVIERKVNDDMEKAKEFVKKHKKEILISVGIIFVYRIGVKHGCEAAEHAMASAIYNAARAVEVTHF